MTVSLGTEGEEVKKMKYTPGPWKAAIKQSYTLGRGSSKLGPMFQIEADPQSYYWVAYVQDSVDGFGMGNALLIAAAPELLAVVKKMVADEAFAELCQGIGEEPEWLKLGREAVRKAEGK